LDTQSLISAGKMRSDGGDIRFTDSDETTLLNYWVESGINTSSTKIWVKVPSIPASSSKTIYVYYGNPSATSLSSATNTFIREIDGGQPVMGSWHMDETSGSTVGDASGNSNTGTASGTTIVDGRFNKARIFNGTSDYINVPDASSLRLTTAGTVEAWINISSTATDDRVVLIKGTSASNISYGMHFDNPPVAITFWVDSDGYWGPTCTVNTGSNSIASNTWYHVVGTWGGGNIRIYLNGSLVNSATCTASAFNNTAPVKIGGNVSSWQYWYGLIDEVRIYNRALTAEEISDLYNNYGYTTTNYPGRVLVRKYTSPEPTTSVGTEEIWGIGTRRRLLLSTY
jgi:hypothetical protein